MQLHSARPKIVFKASVHRQRQWRLLTISILSIVLGATTQNLPPGVLYRVKATYKYVQEDGDELSFDVGDIINVVEYEDPEDQVRAAYNRSSCIWTNKRFFAF